MADMTMTQNILFTIGETIKPTVGSYYYLTRPNAFNEEVKHFAVIDLPTIFRRQLTGDSDEQTSTTGIIYVFSKAKTNNTPNIGDLTALSEGVRKLFPIKGNGFSCMRPDMQYMGVDQYGYQCSRISFRIYIKNV